MPTKDKDRQQRTCLIVGNYCHDILIKDGDVIGESLGAAAAFISAVLGGGFDLECNYICKVGSDFKYSVTHSPTVCKNSQTTKFHAYFSSEITRHDRVLKRVGSCDPITASDLPDSEFDFGLAVGVAGEILPETLDRMIEICNTVFVDIQALIRVFDPIDGTVDHVSLNNSKFFDLIPRIGFLKASSEEALYVDVEKVRKWCCVVVTNGSEGCRVYSKDEELKIAPFPTTQLDPTGAGDSFLGGFVAGISMGLTVNDSALLGNFFGSLTVGHLGLPKFESQLLQRVEAEVERRLKNYDNNGRQEDDEFFTSLDSLRSVPSAVAVDAQQDCKREEWLNSPKAKCSDQQRLIHPVEPIKSLEYKQ